MMSHTHKFAWATAVLLMAVLSLNACGGGGGSSEGTVVVPVNNSLTGFASAGSPLPNAEVTLIGSNGSGTITTLTNGEGRYNVTDLGKLDFPIRVELMDKSLGQTRVLQGIAVRGQRVAHLTPASDVITRAALINTASVPTATELIRLSNLLSSGLQPYLDAGRSYNFLSDSTFRPDSTDVDAVFDLVEMQFRQNRIVLTSRIDPLLRREINPADTSSNNPLPKVGATAAVDPAVVRNLVTALNQVFVSGNLTATGFRDVFHADFQDDEGRTASDFAVAFTNSSQLRVNGFQILRCFPDTARLIDRCQIRLKLARPLQNFNEDFNNAGFSGLVSNEAYDLIAERRDLVTSPLKFAGGSFKPYAASMVLAYTQTSAVASSGLASLPNGVSAAVSLNVPVPASGTQIVSPAELFNSNLNRAELVQRGANGLSSTLFSLIKAGPMECEMRARKLVRNPSGSTPDCGNAIIAGFVTGLSDISRAGEIGVDFTENFGSTQTVTGVRALRVNEPEAIEASFFPVLDRLSLANLHAFGNDTLVRNVVLTLVPPPGFPNVCLVAESFDKPVCVRATRRISLTDDQLARGQAYILFSTDRDGNRFQQRYTFQ